MSLPSFQAVPDKKYSYRFYLNVAHLVDENNHTACNRQLSRSDPPDPSKVNAHAGYECDTCLKHFKKYGLKIIVKEGNGEKTQ